MKRPDITPRLSDSSSVDRLAESTQQAIDTIPLVSFRWLRGHVAGGLTTSELPPIPWPGRLLSDGALKPPDAVFALRVVPVLDQTANLAFVTPAVNYFMRGSDLVVYEPQGLDSGTEYDILLQFVAGVKG